MKISERLMKHLTAGLVAFVALVVYCLTMAPTVSFWDCGEFIACANTLGIPHPPGTPFFVFLGRAVIVLLPFVEEIAKRVNYISVVSSAATVYVAVLFAWDFLAKILSKDSLKEKLGNGVRKMALVAAGLVAGFLLTFSDTFWFNAVEAEVYGLAMFILVLISYLGLVWYDKRNDVISADRILIFICYIAFLGVGAHLYTMLTVPAVFVLLLLAEPKKIAERWPIWITGTILCSVIYYVSAFVEWSILLLVVLAILTAVRPFSPRVMHAIRLSLAFAFFALVGYSTHLYIPIRSELNPIIDENDPEINWRDDQGNLQISNLLKDENWVAFNNFIERKQYGSESMISRAFYRRSRLAHQFLSFPHMGFGGYQIAQYLPFKVGEVNSYDGVYSFDPQDNAPLERFGVEFPTQMMAMGDQTGFQLVWFILFNGLLVAVCVYAYKRHKKYGIFLSVLYGLCSLGLLFYINFADGTRLEKRDYDYWVSVMSRTVSELNATGIKIGAVPDPNDLIDARQEIVNAQMALETARARGLSAGEINALEKRFIAAQNAPVWKNWSLIENAYARMGRTAPFPQPVHLEVRERDYFYTPAFIFMSIMFGIGAGILVWLLAAKMAVLALPLAVALAVVSFVIPCVSNYTEHDRSGLWVPWDYAYNLLNSCRPNAILFTNGDNDTFPLWFAQEVAGIRKDVRVVNLSLGNTDWYIKQILDNEPKLKLSYDKTAIVNDMVLEGDYTKNPNNFVQTWLLKGQNLLPKLKARIQELETDTTNKNDSLLFMMRSNYQVWDAFCEWAEKNANGLMITQHKLVLDLAIQNPDRPFHFSTTVGMSNALGLDKYMVQEGMIYNFIRGDLQSRKGDFDVVRTEQLVDSVYQYRGLGDGTAYINDETSRLLSSYTSLYLQIAGHYRGIMDQLNREPYTQKVKNQMDSCAQAAMKYLELGMKQFPEEWRSYYMAALVYQAAFDKKSALAVLLRGLQAVPTHEIGGRSRLEMVASEISRMSDTPKEVLPEESVTANSDSLRSDAAVSENDSAQNTKVAVSAN